MSPQGDDSRDGLTPAKALLTPQKAADRTEPGDSVLLAGGEYSISDGQGILVITRSGKPDQPITYAPMPEARVVLRNRGAWQVIKVVSAKHIEIRGFEAIGPAETITLEEAQREMSNLGNPRTCGNGIGITDDPTTKQPSAFVTVRDCRVSYMSGGGIFASHVDHITIENCVVSHCGFWSPYANSGISVYQPQDIDPSADYKIIIRNNVSFANYNNIPFYYSNTKDPSKRKVTDGNGIIIDDFENTQAFGGAREKGYAGKTLIANNVVFDNGGSGIHALLSHNVDMVHNYAAGNNRHPQMKDGQIFANQCKDLRVLNNVLIAPAGKPVNSNYRNAQDVVYDYNVYAIEDGSKPTFTQAASNNRIGAAQITLTDWAKGSRAVSAGANSPARGGGKAFPEAGTDFFGHPRPSPSPDIGPFQLP